MRKQWGGVLFIFMMCLLTRNVQAEDAGWLAYKQRFILSEGRVMDTGNSSVSHSEGQGYGMLLAQINDDKATFDSLWQWTQKNLWREDNGLFAWRYDPQKKQVSDRNNATDGDMLIGWALLRAGTQWGDKDYLLASEKIQRGLLTSTLASWANRSVMLPGAEGFKHKGYINLNPSYFIFPAWQAFYRYSHRQQWKVLIDDALILLNDMQFGQSQLPSDWVTLRQDGTLFPAAQWPARFSFDAIRIPLYLNWYHKHLTQNTPFSRYWMGTEAAKTPAWIDVSNGNVAEYPLSPGMRAVRSLTLDRMWQEKSTILPQEDYYSASLKLLAQAADKEGKS